MQSERSQPMDFGIAGPLRGTARVPGDKSISHRALMLAAMALGNSRIEGLSEGTDVGSTAAALQAMGVRIQRDAGGAHQVSGVGTGCLISPEAPLDVGNSGTSARLLMGLVASHPITANFTGDTSLRRRPMARVIEPLQRLGAQIAFTPSGRLPLTIQGASPALALSHETIVPSAQVKSAILLAGLNTPGSTEVAEPVPTRDHTERMLKLFGGDVRAGAGRVRLFGEAELRPQLLTIPGDFSSAAFLIVAALITPGSELRLETVGVNPMRTGLLDVLHRMGADISLSGQRELGNEPVADLEVRHSRLRAVDVPPELAPSMIDEYPAFFIAAAFAEGTSRARGLSELRVKESDRIAKMAEGLSAIGVRARGETDSMTIEGSAGAPLPGGGLIDPELDHRIAMSFAVAGLHAKRAITVATMSPVATSFPGFPSTLAGLQQP